MRDQGTTLPQLGHNAANEKSCRADRTMKKGASGAAAFLPFLPFLGGIRQRNGQKDWRAPRLGPEVGRMQARDKNREFTVCDKCWGNIWKR